MALDRSLASRRWAPRPIPSCVASSFVRARRAIDNVIGSVALRPAEERAAADGHRRARACQLPVADAARTAGRRPVRCARHDLCAARRWRTGPCSARSVTSRSRTRCRCSTTASPQCARSRATCAVDGRIVFSMRGEFPRAGRTPSLRLDDLQDDIRWSTRRAAPSPPHSRRCGSASSSAAQPNPLAR